MSIIDNIIIAQEFTHSMRNKLEKRTMAIKIDLLKAYDRLSWRSIEHTLKDVGYLENFIKLMMFCVCSPRMQVLWNGCPPEEFFPSHGVWQGDGISLYLFVLCMERLA